MWLAKSDFVKIANATPLRRHEIGAAALRLKVAPQPVTETYNVISYPRPAYGQ